MNKFEHFDLYLRFLKNCDIRFFFNLALCLLQYEFNNNHQGQLILYTNENKQLTLNNMLANVANAFNVLKSTTI